MLVFGFVPECKVGDGGPVLLQGKRLGDLGKHQGLPVVQYDLMLGPELVFGLRGDEPA